MLDISDYDAVFQTHDKNTHSGYPKSLQNDIDNNRHQLGGKLFFDRLLDLLQIQAEKLYPPRTEKALKELHKRIVNAPTLLHNKHCLLFYLLKDLSPSTHSDVELATSFSSAVHLPNRYFIFLEGLWALDHLAFEEAVESLTHPSIIPTFPDEILDVLLQNVENTKNNLPMAYFLSANPPLVDSHVRDEFVKYMARRDLTETFYWIRGRPYAERRHLFELVVARSLDSSIMTTKEMRTEMAMELVQLPFCEEEEEWFEGFLLEGQGRNLQGARDTVLVRRIATGRVGEAVKEEGGRGRRLDAVDWEVLRDGLRRGLGPRVDEGSRYEVV